MDYKKIFNEAKLEEARPKYEDERLQWIEKPEDADQYDDWVLNTDNWSDTCGVLEMHTIVTQQAMQQKDLREH